MVRRMPLRKVRAAIGDGVGKGKAIGQAMARI